MDPLIGIIPLVLVVGNVIVSIRGFSNPLFFSRYDFHIKPIVRSRQYHRFFTSGFLHVNWPHLLFNMFALYSFSYVVQMFLGGINFLFIYVCSLFGGNLLAFAIHKNRLSYRAAGASGAVSGIVFTSIVLYPTGRIGILFLPGGIPSWLFGILFILISIFGIRKRIGNIGHEAHLGGAICGVLLTLGLKPDNVPVNPLVVLGILLPALFFLFMTFKPGLIGIRISPRDDPADGFNEGDARAMEREINRLLEKVSAEGIDALTEGERLRLRELAEKRRK